jgi:hypothetical protein
MLGGTAGRSGLAAISDTREMTDESPNAGRGQHRTQIAVAWIGVVGLVLAAAFTGGFGLLTKDEPSKTPAASVTANGGQSTNQDTCVNGSVIQGDVNCTKTSQGPAQPVATTADAGCGSFEDAPAGTRLRMKVLMWCAPEAVRGQYEYKLKVSIKNTGTSVLDIRPERFKLVWRTLNPQRWSPPPGGAYGPPKKVLFRERKYWMISANLDGAAEAIPGANGATFATHWDHSALGPGETSLRPRSGNHSTLRYRERDGTLRTIRFNHKEDDLVFYVPARTVNRDHNFLGLAYYNGDRIIALCPQGQWGPKVSPLDF